MDWHYAENGQQIGPVTEEKLVDLAKAGNIAPETLVWRTGMAEWKPFREAGPAVPPPIPPASDLISTGPRRVCNSCGLIFATEDLAVFGDAAICANCKPAWVQRLRQGMISVEGGQRYGGFWIRLGAQFMDGLIIGVVQGALMGGAFVDYFRLVYEQAQVGGQPSADQIAGFSAAILRSSLIVLVLQIAYQLFFTIRYGATLGKMACGLRIVDEGGGKISPGQAVGRYFATWLSTFLFYIGYLMAAWDSQKRALHDRLAGTRVIRTR